MVRPIALTSRRGRGRKIKREAAEQFSRPPLARMMQLHAQLQARKFPNCRKLAHELEVSAKTIQRDIEFMRYQLGLPIEYRPAAFRFRLHGTGHEFSEHPGFRRRDRGAVCRAKSAATIPRDSV